MYPKKCSVRTLATYYSAPHHSCSCTWRGGRVRHWMISCEIVTALPLCVCVCAAIIKRKKIKNVDENEKRKVN